MPRYIAFLRAINVGGHTVKMDRLRALFEEVGLENVSTFIASGNVIFDSPLEDVLQLENRIDKHLREALGYEVGTFIRTPAELAAVAEHPPFTAEEVAGAASLYVNFLPSAAGAETAALVAGLSTADNILRIHGRELYWLCHTRISDSDIPGPQLGRALGMPMTMRNMNTVRRIVGKAEARS